MANITGEINAGSLVGTVQAETNGAEAVKYVAQTLTDEQKAQARTNINAHLYWHSVNVVNGNVGSLNYSVFITVLSADATAIDKSGLQTLINSDHNAKFICVSGGFSSYSKMPAYLVYNTDESFSLCYYNGSINPDSLVQAYSLTDLTVVDAVNQIL